MCPNIPAPVEIQGTKPGGTSHISIEYVEVLLVSKKCKLDCVHPNSNL